MAERREYPPSGLEKNYLEEKGRAIETRTCVGSG